MWRRSVNSKRARRARRRAHRLARERAEAKVTSDVFADWFARRAAPQPTGPGRWHAWWTDGESVFCGTHCLLTWQRGPAAYPDTRPALLNGRRYNTRQARQHRIPLLEECLRGAGVPYVRVVPIGSAHSTDRPDDLRDGWAEAVARARELAGGVPYATAAERLVQAMLRGLTRAVTYGGLRARADARAIYVDATCLVAWAPDGAGVLVSGRESRAGTHRQRLRDALVQVLRRRGLRLQVVQPVTPSRYVHEADLLAAWASQGRLRLVRAP